MRAEHSRGKWSLKELVCHFRRMESIFGERFRAMLSDENTVIVPYDDPDGDEVFVELTRRPTEEVVAEYLTEREALCRRLESLSPADWHRKAKHPEFPHYDVHFQAEYMAHHEAHHISSAVPAPGAVGLLTSPRFRHRAEAPVPPRRAAFAACAAIGRSARRLQPYFLNDRIRSSSVMALLCVAERDDAAVDLVELEAGEGVADSFATMFHRVAPGVFSSTSVVDGTPTSAGLMISYVRRSFSIPS